MKLKEKERRIKLGQSVQSLKSTNDVLNLLADTTKSDITGHLIEDDKNIPLFQIGIYPNYSYKDLEKKYKQKSEQDITALFNEFNSPKKSNTGHSLTNNSHVASLFKNSRLYSQTLPSMNDMSPTEDVDITTGYGHSSVTGIDAGTGTGTGTGTEFRSSSATLHPTNNKYYDDEGVPNESYTQSESYTTESESYTQSESFGREEGDSQDPDKSLSLSQSIFTALRQKQSLR